MSKNSRATPPTDVVRELDDAELEKVSGGYTFTDVMVESIVAPRDLNTGHTAGLVALLIPKYDE